MSGPAGETTKRLPVRIALFFAIGLAAQVALTAGSREAKAWSPNASRYCVRTFGTAFDCSYDTLPQCYAATGAMDRLCYDNPAYVDEPLPYWRPVHRRIRRHIDR